MSPSMFEGFEFEEDEENVVEDKPGGPTMESARITGRRRLSDITNTTAVPLGSSWTNNCESVHSTTLIKGNTAYLLKEIGKLKRLLAEKEAIIESQRNELKKLWFNWGRASQQNRQLIKTNGQMFKELAFDREKLKLLQHEYNQMSAMFKVKSAELEQKANELSQQLQGIQECKLKKSGQNQDAKQVQLKLSSSRESSDSSDCMPGNICIEGSGIRSFTPDGNANEDNLSGKRICLRRRSAKISYKEPSLLKKLRQQEQTVSPVLTSPESVHHGAFNGIETLEKVCEDEVLDISSLAQSESKCQDLQASRESQDVLAARESCGTPEDSFDSTIKISSVRGKPTRVQLGQQELVKEQEHAPSDASSSSIALEATLPPRRSSSGRPMRKAAEVVASYKEIPLNVKMRRPA